jgi:hypothetical protein
MKSTIKDTNAADPNYTYSREWNSKRREKKNREKKRHLINLIHRIYLQSNKLIY